MTGTSEKFRTEGALCTTKQGICDGFTYKPFLCCFSLSVLSPRTVLRGEILVEGVRRLAVVDIRTGLSITTYVVKPCVLQVVERATMRMREKQQINF